MSAATTIVSSTSEVTTDLPVDNTFDIVESSSITAISPTIPSDIVETSTITEILVDKTFDIETSSIMATSSNIPSPRYFTVMTTVVNIGDEENVTTTHFVTATGTEVSTAEEVMDANTTTDYSSDNRVTLTSFNFTEYNTDFDTASVSLLEHVTQTIINTNNKNAAQMEYIDYVGKISLPIALIVGLIGNGITIATMMTKPFTSISWSVVLVCLAVADTVVLLAVPFNKPFVIRLIGQDIPAINTTTCKLYHFIRRISKMVSAWLVVFVCFERFIAVCFPMKVKRICTRRRTVISIISLVFASTAYCSLWVTTADLVNGLCIQTVATPETRFKAMLYIILGSVLIVVLPMAIMVVLTPITCFVLRRHMLLRSQLASASGQTDTYTKATAMLVSLCIAYVVLLFPTMLSYNLAFYYKQSIVTTTNTMLIALREVSQVLELINYSSNFFLYTAFNELFRRRVMHCVTCNARQTVITEATSCTQMQDITMSEQTDITTVSHLGRKACHYDANL